MTNIVKTSHITHIDEIDGSVYDITYGFGYVNNRLEVVEMNIKPRALDGIVSQKVLRALSPMEATRNIRLMHAGGSNSEFGPLMKKWENTPEQLETITRLYREAYSTGTSIEKHIAERINRPLSTVNRWIGYARKHGYLRPAKSTRGGEVAETV